MFACWSDAATLISRSNRAALSPAANSVEDFHDDAAAESPLFGNEDARHAAAAQRAVERVRATQTRLELVAEGH